MDIPLTESLFVGVAVIAVVKLIDLLADGDYRSASKVIAAAAIGAIAGTYGIDGLNVTTGMVAGLSAAGVVTLANKLATKPASEPITPFDR